MEIYILDNKMMPLEIVTEITSLAWTERHSEPGEFELIVPAKSRHSSLLRIGTFLGSNITPRVMIVETVEVKNNSEGQKLLTASGRSLEAILNSRVAREHLLITSEDEVWKFNETKPAAIMRTIFRKICMEGVLHERDVIPYITTRASHETPYYPTKGFSTGMIPEPDIPIDMEIGIKSVSEALNQVVSGYPSLGYRLYRHMEVDSTLYFDVYTGQDRTLLQNTNTPVIFSLPWGMLESTSSLDSIADYYNVLYVFSEFGVVSVDRDISEDSNYRGFDRKVGFLEVKDDYSDSLRGAELRKYLRQKGEEHLATLNRVAMFEGELSANTKYRYNVDYNLGDNVDLIGDDNSGARMIVSEVIFTKDDKGTKVYPTLKMLDHIEPDTWSAFRGAEVWSTMPGSWIDYR